MRYVNVYVVLCFVFVAVNGGGGCTVQKTEVMPAPAEASAEEHPRVMIEGIDGTVLYGRLLNSIVTIESGQGPLNLLTSHIRTIHISDNGDSIDSQSVQVSGQLKDETFQLKNEHGVIPLLAERLRKITFLDAPAPGPATGPSNKSSPASPSQSELY